MVRPQSEPLLYYRDTLALSNDTIIWVRTKVSAVEVTARGSQTFDLRGSDRKTNSYLTLDLLMSHYLTYDV